MPQDITLELSIPPDEAAERLALAVTRACPFWDAARAQAGPERLIGHVESGRFRVFLSRYRSRGCPRYAMGQVRGSETGSQVGVHIGLKTWDRFGLVFGLSAVTVAATVAVAGLGLLAREGFSFLPNAILVVIVWLATSAMVVADWQLGRGEEPALRQALEALFHDVTVTVHESR
jgi:hypothetical protein